MAITVYDGDIRGGYREREHYYLWGHGGSHRRNAVWHFIT